jgi:tellurite resistance protein
VTPNEKSVLRSLVAVAWADGRLADGETGVIEGLLSGFDATDEEEQEILEYAKTRRTLAADIPLGELGPDDRELLLSNAVLLTHMDGEQTDKERAVLDELIRLLGFSRKDADAIVTATLEGLQGVENPQRPGN